MTAAAIPAESPVALVDVALAYAARGWPVFPLDPRGKKPLGHLAPHGLKEATTDAARIRAWWTDTPDANIGIPTGIAFDVADLDKRAALDRLLELAKSHGLTEDDVRAGPRVRTGAGWHLLFAPTGLGNRARVLEEGLDWRGAGGYVVAAGSVHSSGRPYRWQVEPNGEGFPPAPAFLRDLLDRKRPAQQAQDGDRPAEAYVRKAVDDELANVRGARPGARNDTLNRAAFSIGQMVGAGWMLQHVAEAELRAAGLASGLEAREVDATVASGLASGAADPRPAPATAAAGTIRGDQRAMLASQGQDVDQVVGATWRPSPLGQVLDDHDVRPEPTLLSRVDGVKLLYPGRVTSFYGEPETLKTFGALVAAVEALAAGGRVLVLDFDNSAADYEERLMALGVSRDIARSRVDYTRPEEPLSDEGVTHILAAAARQRYDLVIVDGVNNALAASGMDHNSGKEFRGWFARLIRPLQLSVPGPVLMLDHVAKDRERRGQWAVGAGDKLAVLDGAAVGFELVQHFGRGRIGSARMILQKDRPGVLRGLQGQASKLIATLRLTSLEDGRIHAELLAPTKVEADAGGESPKWQPTGYMERISKLLEESADGIGFNALRDCLAGKRDYVRSALDALLAGGFIEVVAGPRGSSIHRSLRPFREASDGLVPDRSPTDPQDARGSVGRLVPERDRAPNGAVRRGPVDPSPHGEAPDASPIPEPGTGEDALPEGTE